MKTLPQKLIDGDGSRFGDIQVVVDVENRRCAYRLERGDAPKKIVRLDSPEEINGACAHHTGLAGANPISADIVSALRFAARQIRDKRWGRS